jgi:hypothetical protein
MRHLLLALLLATRFAIGATAAAEALDQSSPNGDTDFNGHHSGFNWQQEVHVGIAGKLTRVEIEVEIPGTTFFYLNVGAPWQADPNDFETTIVANSRGTYSIDVSSANIQLAVDDRFVIGIQGTDGEGEFWVGGTCEPGLYDRGELYIQADPLPPSIYWVPCDFAFRTYVQGSDGDDDGVFDADDACPSTAIGEVVNAGGCAVSDLCPCVGADPWKNHGAYVSCVSHATTAFLAEGLLTHAEKAAVHSTAGASDCGKHEK